MVVKVSFYRCVLLFHRFGLNLESVYLYKYLDIETKKPRKKYKVSLDQCYNWLV